MTTCCNPFIKQLTCCIILISFHSTIGQSVQKEELTAAYVYSFAKNIEWPQQAQFFVIQLITDNQELIKEFEYLKENRNIKGRPIRVMISPSAIIAQDAQIVFISNNYNSVVRSVFLQARDQRTLIVTDEFQDDRFTMINFRSAENNTITFEINRANIINQGLTVLPEMILLGGTDIDMARLYREAQDSIQVLESKIGGLQSRYDSLFVNAAAIQNSIYQQQDLIRHQSDEIKEKQRIILSQSSSLDSLSVGVEESERKLNALAEQMRVREEDFLTLQDNIRKQQVQMEEGRLVLEEQFRLIKEQDDLISERETSLEKMISVISSQKRTVGLLILFSLIAIGFLLAIFRAYKLRRNDARKLAEQRDELSKLLSELQQTQSQLVQSEKMASLGVLTAGIAHEINNAINFVASGIYVLEANIKEVTPVITQVKRLKRDGNLAENVEKLIDIKEQIGYSNIQKMIQEVLKNIKIGAERTTEIVKGLRNFSMSNTEIVTEIDLVNEIEVAVLLLNNRIKNKIDLRKEYDDKSLFIDGFKGQLGQVFLNILGNAVDALEQTEKPEIIIKLTKPKGKVKIEITDNGSGMDEKELDKIFDPFYTTKKIGAGTGLGLSIAYGIIEHHQGTIDVTSKKDKGTKFTILLPLKIVH